MAFCVDGEVSNVKMKMDANQNMCYLLFWPFSKIILGQYNISVALMAFTIELSRITEK